MNNLKSLRDMPTLTMSVVMIKEGELQEAGLKVQLQ